MISIYDQGKSYMGLLKNPFLDPYDDLERHQTSPRAPQQIPVKHFTHLKFMLAAGAYSWCP